MAGQARNRGTRAHGRSGRAVASWPVLAAASAAVSGSTAPIPTRHEPTETSAVATRSTYRMLLIKGLAPDEAANLTAFLCGIPLAAQTWKIKEVNQLLFLRELNRSGHFGQADGTDAQVH
jgi:hypothetical protein